MGLITKGYHGWEGAKMIGISFVLSLMSGWLMREMVQGKISADNKAALFILLATVVTLMAVLCTTGIRRWKRGELAAMEKRLLVFSVVMYPVCFVFGYWLLRP